MRYPAAERVHDDGAGEILERRAENRIEEVLLQPEVAVPVDAFKQRVEQPDHGGGSHRLGGKPRALGDAAGDDCRHRRCKGAEEEEAHERVALRAVARRTAGDRRGALQEPNAVGDRVPDGEIGDGGDGEVDQDFDERVDLILVADRPGLKERKSAMHGENEDCAHQ